MGTKKGANQDQVLLAIQRIAAAARLVVLDNVTSARATCQAVSRVADCVRVNGGERARDLALQLAQTALQPVEPRTLSWNVFELFGIDGDEPAWTRWLAGLLKERSGVGMSSIAWRALCRAAGEALQNKPGASAADAAWWKEAARSPLEGVECEFAYPEQGAVDLVLTSPGRVVVMENKLWEDWHDWSNGRKQADRYRDIAKALGARKQHGYRLVLLSARDDLEYIDGTSPGELEVPADYLWISFEQVARALRAEVARAQIPVGHALGIWPLIVTINAIERLLLGIEVPAPANAGWRDLSQLAKAVSLIPHLDSEV